MLGEVVIESKPSGLTFVRKKDKQAQMMVADLSLVRLLSILYASFRLSLLTIDCKHVSCVSTSFSISFTAKYCPVTILTMSALSTKKE
jgi:hypothetical protein